MLGAGEAGVLQAGLAFDVEGGRVPAAVGVGFQAGGRLRGRVASVQVRLSHTSAHDHDIYPTACDSLSSQVGILQYICSLIAHN